MWPPLCEALLSDFLAKRFAAEHVDVNRRFKTPISQDVYNFVMVLFNRAFSTQRVPRGILWDSDRATSSDVFGFLVPTLQIREPW